MSDDDIAKKLPNCGEIFFVSYRVFGIRDSSVCTSWIGYLTMEQRSAEEITLLLPQRREEIYYFGGGNSEDEIADSIEEEKEIHYFANKM